MEGHQQARCPHVIQGAAPRARAITDPLLAEVPVGRVLTGVRLFVIEILDEAVIPSSKRATEKRTDPVNPMIAGERCTGNGGTEAAGGIEGAAGVVDAYRLSVACFNVGA